jgi:beta-mannosidase
VDIYKKGQNFSTAPVQSADWIVNVTLLVQSATAWDSPSLTLSFPELNQTKKFAITKIPADVSSPTTISAQWTLPDGVAERWYPYNLGTPKLYNLTVGLELAPSTSVESTIRTGFRTIYLAQTAYSQKEIDERGIIPGDQWHFEINGKAFYAKGTNIIPFDPFYSRINNDKVRWVLESAKNSGQNMVRDTLQL